MVFHCERNHHQSPTCAAAPNALRVSKSPRGHIRFETVDVESRQAMAVVQAQLLCRTALPRETDRENNREGDDRYWEKDRDRYHHRHDGQRGGDPDHTVSGNKKSRRPEAAVRQASRPHMTYRATEHRRHHRRDHEQPAPCEKGEIGCYGKRQSVERERRPGCRPAKLENDTLSIVGDDRRPSKQRYRDKRNARSPPLMGCRGHGSTIIRLVARCLYGRPSRRPKAGRGRRAPSGRRSGSDLC